MITSIGAAAKAASNAVQHRASAGLSLVSIVEIPRDVGGAGTTSGGELQQRDKKPTAQENYSSLSREQVLKSGAMTAANVQRLAEAKRQTPGW